MQGAIKTSKGTIAYHKFGNGAQVAIALHGFYQSGRAYEHLAGQLTAFTVFALDLPWHGNSNWQASFYTPEDLQSVFHRILDQENQSRFLLIGFSLGGRLALSMAPTLQAQLSGLLIIAPDGIAGQFGILMERIPKKWRRRIGQYTGSGRRLIRASYVLYRLGLLSRFGYLFVDRHLQDGAHRRRLFLSWYSIAFFPIDRRQILQMTISTDVLIGRNDLIIRPEQVKRFLRSFPKVQLWEMEGGHDLLIAASVANIPRQLITELQ